jgi:hypothetical protein
MNSSRKLEQKRKLIADVNTLYKKGMSIETACNKLSTDDNLITKMMYYHALKLLNHKSIAKNMDVNKSLKVNQLIDKLNNNQCGIYFMKNDSLEENMIKIGCSQDITDRAKQLSGTNIPTPYYIYKSLKCSNPTRLESITHKYFNDYKVAKEFYEINFQ